MIDENDWSKFVSAHYGRPYRLQQQDGCMDRGTYGLTVPDIDDDKSRNDSIPEEINGSLRGVKFKVWLERDPTILYEDGYTREHPSLRHSFNEMFWHRNFYPELQVIANDLHAKGLLPAGDYLIDIDW